MGKRRIILVDDEQRIVEGLQRALRMYRDAWDVSTATSGAAALALFEQGPVDVIVSDMRMPEMDGAELLARVKRHYPATMRIVLSGQTDAAAAVRAMPVAHQFLNKPTDPTCLRELLSRASAMKERLPDERIHAALGGLDALPSPRAVRDDLGQTIALGGTLDEVVCIVERDPALVLKLLQIVNSAFFGLRRRICDVAEAIAYLGMDLVKEIFGVGGPMRTLSLAPQRMDVGAYHNRAHAIASVARNIAGPSERGAIAFSAGLLNDIGRLAIAATMPDLSDDMHVAVAAYLLDLWGLPRAVVDALLEHVAVGLDLDARQKLEPADAIWLARRALNDDAVDPNYIARMGITERWNSLRLKAA